METLVYLAIMSAGCALCMLAGYTFTRLSHKARVKK